MMKRLGVFLFSVVLLCWSDVSFAVPLNWTGFGPFVADDPVTRINDTTISFGEDLDLSAVFYFNSSYTVPDNAGILSFDYSIILGEEDYDDYLTFEAYDGNWDAITYNAFPIMSGGPLSGDFELDLSPYRSRDIALLWGFIEGELVTSVGSTATVYNIDLSVSSTPVPEPGTILLFGIGLAGVLGLKRKNLFK